MNYGRIESDITQRGNGEWNFPFIQEIESLDAPELFTYPHFFGSILVLVG